MNSAIHSPRFIKFDHKIYIAEVYTYIHIALTEIVTNVHEEKRLYSLWEATVCLHCFKIYIWNGHFLIYLNVKGKFSLS